MSDNILGINGIPASNQNAGVGFVIIPKNIDIKTYKEDVYRSGRISIYGGYGHSNFNNILIDREVLQRIKFPENSEEKGSAVVWLNIPYHNEPIVIACLKYDEDFHSISENRKRDTRTDGENMVDWDLDGNNAKVKLQITANDKNNGEIEINIASVKHSAKFKIIIDGEVLQKTSGRTIRISENIITDLVTDISGIVRGKFELNPNEDSEHILHFEDDYGNKITSKEKELNIRADKSKTINLGDGSEPIVLAKTLKSILDRFDDALSKMTVPTAFGPSGTRINADEFKSVREDFEKFFSKLTNSD